MGAAARGGLAALAIALALAALRLSSLNAGALGHDALAAWQRQTGGEARAASTAFTLFPSAGLRLQGIEARMGGLRIHADEALVSLRWIPLLLGKVEIDTLVIPDAELRLPPSHGPIEAPDAAWLARLPLDRLRLIRARLDDAKGRVLLDEISLDLRHPGPNREMLWELQAGHGDKALRGHGRLDFRLGRLARGFGKFRFRNLNPDAPLALLTNRRLPAAASGWRANGAVTLRLAGRERWSAFGETDLATADGIIHLRGKIEHEQGVTRWRDSFAHFPNQGVISLEGACEQGACLARAHLRNMPLRPAAAWLPGGGGHRIDGAVSGDLESAWQENGDISLAGDIDGEATMSVGERRLRLPPFRLHLARAALRAGAIRLSADIAPRNRPRAAAIALRAAREDGRASLVISRAENWPAGASALAQALLALRLPDAMPSAPAESEGKQAPLSFDRLAWERQGKRETLRADKARITGAIAWQGFEKPAGTPAACERIALHRDGAASRWRLERCRMAGNQWRALTLSSQAAHETLLHIEGGNLDFDALARAGVRLPAPWQSLRGKITGDARLRLAGESRELRALAGKLALQDFGLPDWRFSGQLQAENGRIRGPHLLLRGPRGHASLALQFDPEQRSGTLALLDGRLDWSSPAAPPAWLRAISLEGRIEQASLRWLGQNFRIAAPSFHWRNGELTMISPQARVAGGRIRARKLRLAPDARGAVKLSGDVRASGVRLSRLEKLADLLRARLQGRLHANLRLDLVIPGEIRAWRANGDLLIFSGAWQPLQGPSAGHAFAFRRLDARLRLRDGALRISRLRLLSHQRRYQGDLRIAHGRFNGEVRTPERERIRIEGDWPLPNWHILAPER